MIYSLSFTNQLPPLFHNHIFLSRWTVHILTLYNCQLSTMPLFSNCVLRWGSISFPSSVILFHSFFPHFIAWWSGILVPSMCKTRSDSWVKKNGCQLSSQACHYTLWTTKPLQGKHYYFNSQQATNLSLDILLETERLFLYMEDHEVLAMIFGLWSFRHFVLDLKIILFSET